MKTVPMNRFAKMKIQNGYGKSKVSWTINASIMHPKDISIINYTYTLPEDRIAAFPLSDRDRSKLLIYKNSILQEDRYENIAQFLPAQSLLVFNNTRVIQARILFQKSSGSIIEIFCLEPYEAVNEFSTILNKKGRLRWKCLVGGAGKWKKK